MSEAPVELISARARRLFLGGALNAVLRESTVLTGDAWIADRFPLIFDRGQAVAAGYVVSARVDPWSTDPKKKWPATYEDRKRAWQGHDIPLVWTGRLRSEIYHHLRASAVATKGVARGEIHFGRFDVTDASGNSKQLPEDHIVRRVMLTLRRGDEQYLADQVLANVAVFVEAQGAPVKSAGKLGPEPPVIIDRRISYANARMQARNRARVGEGTISEFMERRRETIHERLAAWRVTAGGAAPIASTLGRAMTPDEARLQHNSQARTSYKRNRSAILARRRGSRVLRRSFSFLRTHNVPRPPKGS